MLPKALCFLDLETTGTNPRYNRIIEVGIIRIEDNKIVKKINTLINPESGVPDFIKGITGINSSDVENAPLFYEVKDEIKEILVDAILVAHNVRFDYGFLKNEFKRCGESFSNKHFCSIKLTRQLFPGLDHYNLDSVISKFDLKCKKRHRAYDDAKVIFDLYIKLQSIVETTVLENAINSALKMPSIPINLSQSALENLPETPGVYIFYGEGSEPIYIGKSVNIRDRVLSHFSGDHASAKEMQIAQLIHNVETIPTAGELGALLLESTLIKKHKPLYNSMLRDARKMVILKSTVDKNGFNTIETLETDKIEATETENIIGIFKSRKQLKDHLHELAKQFNLCPKLLGLDHSKSVCFYYHLNICFGACDNREIALKYNMRFTEAFYKYKIKRWAFETPVIIKETGETNEGFVVDKWCLLGRVKTEDDLQEISNDYIFDLDTYKILSKFISKPKNSISINKFVLPQTLNT